jgi:hypothetical protein
VARADDRSDKSQAAFEHGLAAGCRKLGMSGEDCAAFDGRIIGPERVAAYERSWVHYALTLQREIDADVPLLRALWPHTHNSFNSSVYPSTVTNQDPNQVYSITDQLRMDIRAIEFDLHVLPGQGVVLCHGSGVAVGPTHVDVGCSVDRPLRDGLDEFNGWLRAPGNRNDVVLLYLENQLFDDPAAHDEVVAEISATIGDLVYRPSTRCAQPAYGTLTKNQIRAAGKRVVLVGNCGPGAWGSWVHERGTDWVESSSPNGDDFPAACRRVPGKFVRWYEDSTWLSTMAGGSTSQLTEVEARRMARCGVNLIGFDQLTPEDPRLAAIVWSWAPGWPRVDGSGGDCVANGSDGRWRTAPCGEKRHAACITRGGDRYVSKPAVAWSRLAAACGRGGRPDLPANGYENELLKAAKAKAGSDDVWLRYRRVRG